MNEKLNRFHNIVFKHGYFVLNYAVIGSHGAIHFHFSSPIESPSSPGNYSYCEGLEIHYRNKPEWLGDTSKHDDCFLLNETCWHDGTSLYASEYIMPKVINLGIDWLWGFMEQRYWEDFIEGKE